MNTNDLTAKLDSFCEKERFAALQTLIETESEKTESPEKGWINMHCHTFFSYNAYGYSPAHIAWEARRRKLDAAGIVDFDCLDGTKEFLECGRMLKLKTCAGFETRAYIPEYSDVVINSPKEPGVFYVAGTGFIAPPTEGTKAADTLNSMRQRAKNRNIIMMEKINDYLGKDAAIDYEKDVIPRTPSGNATERHMLSAYEGKMRKNIPDSDRRAAFWASKLNEPESEVSDIIDSPTQLKGLIRRKLMKFGGIGYAEPDPNSFPDLSEAIEMTLECGALPSACWLDGASEGEKDAGKHLKFLRDKGCLSVTIIPDRNWNVDEGDYQWKVGKLDEIVSVGKQLDMIVLAGTEMNKSGNKFVDDFSTSALSKHLETFRKGAFASWGHTLLMMTAGIGITGKWSRRHFGEDVAGRNEFFVQIGSQQYPDEDQFKKLGEWGSQGTPDDYMNILDT